MNAAFRRVDAVNALGQYATTIVIHLTLLTVFPDVDETNHWKKEVNAFRKTLKRLNKGKNKKGVNFRNELIIDILGDEIDSNDEQDNIQLFIENKGLIIPEEGIDWPAVQEKIEEFAKSVMEP